MSFTLVECEQKELRKSGTTTGGDVWYLRTYDIPVEKVEELIGLDGSVVRGKVLPGEKAGDADEQENEVVGPFVKDVRWGPQRKGDGNYKGTVQRIVLEGRKLRRSIRKR